MAVNVAVTDPSKNKLSLPATNKRRDKQKRTNTVKFHTNKSVVKVMDYDAQNLGIRLLNKHVIGKSGEVKETVSYRKFPSNSLLLYY